MKYYVTELEADEGIGLEEKWLKEGRMIEADKHEFAVAQYCKNFSHEKTRDVTDEGLRLLVAPVNDINNRKVYAIGAEISVDFYAEEEK